MVTEIDGLKLPPSLSSSAEIFNSDTSKRTVSGRLITKLSSNQKWRVVVLYEKDTLSLELQTQFYTKCTLLRNTAKVIKFISPYDGKLKSITAKLVSLNTPQIMGLNKVPNLYTKIGAVFEEV